MSGHPHSHSHSHPPVALRRPLWTPGVLVMLAFMAAAAVTLVVRFTGGIGAVSNLSNARPWGLWVAIDVATGVALAAGGFTTAALAHIWGRHRYETVVRPALLTAMLGYSFVVLGLLVDIGRSWAIWKPIFFQNHHSVLFEVAMCVLVYLHVLYIEFVPVVDEGLRDARPGHPLQKLVAAINRRLRPILWIFIVAGVVLSCMHQSSLGSLMLIAPTKVHPLWYTPLLPLLFLLSAIAAGFPMVIVEATLASSSLGTDDEMEVLTPLSRFTIVLLGLYLALKVGDLLWRGSWTSLLDGTTQSNAFLAEMGLGVVLPFLMLLRAKVRRSRRTLFIAALLIVGGVVLNRINVFIVAFTPPLSTTPYSPALGEILITCGFVAALMFCYRLAVTWLPVLAEKKEKTP
ncbi:MAG: Ni/Fe-hydrogenase cytochrome b subunit [Desulfuromonadaceae bacterium]|nr:Ni/Fe-hydrogenase cytochrome b subunit [Desulfuromonadaceae bacterium]